MEVYFTGAGSEKADLQRSEPLAQARGAIYTFLLPYMWHFGVHSKQGGRRTWKSPKVGKGRNSPMGPVGHVEYFPHQDIWIL